LDAGVLSNSLQLSTELLDGVRISTSESEDGEFLAFFWFVAEKKTKKTWLRENDRQIVNEYNYT
jgi:hypothetical protein